MKNIINVLDSSIYNLISAGEVVENPQSIVKELVENSIDAGAKNIKIDIFNGGKSKIIISDDGIGIKSEYIKTAFLPHSTSKVSTASDLDAIVTLGFRGEALASIASVSMITLTSKTKEAMSATQIELKGGTIESITETSGVTGTIISVENLFFNTPARIKFLKKDKTEESKITNLVTNLILSNPSIAFTYTIDNKLLYQTMGEGLKNALLSVYNREITMNLFELENTFKDFSISGFISKPTYFKGNRSWQSVIINGRLIENRTITIAVEKAYEGFLMKRAFPLFVLNINMPISFLDVNVHPNKTDVRFQDNNYIFSFIYHSIRNALNEHQSVKNITKYHSESVADISQNSIINEVKVINDTVADKKLSENKQVEENKQDTLLKTNTNNEINTISENNNNNETNFVDNKSNLFVKGFNIPKHFRADSGISYEVIKKRAESIELNKSFIESSPDVIDFDGKIVGQIFGTYIIVEKQNEIYFIDQHAAHERILYDEFSKDVNIFSQPLLIPYIIETNHTEFDFLNECIAELNQIGFDIHLFGGLSFKVSAVPNVLINIDLSKFFNEVLSDLNIAPNFKSSKILKEKLMQTACKNAIKAGDSLNNEQIEILINMFNKSNKVPLQCPHGRPAVIKISKTEIEKWFKRIV